MRCIGSEGVDLSHLGHSSSHPHHGPGLHDVIMASTVIEDVTNPSPPTSASASADSKSYVSSDSSSLVFPQLSPVSTQSDSDLAQRDSPVLLKDFSALSISPSICPQQQLSSMSSPELNTLSENFSKRSSPGVSSMSSLCVSGGDSGSEESSRTSTAKNTLSSCSSLNTVADELSSGATSSAEILSMSSEGQLEEKTSVGAGSRKMSEGCVRFDDGIISDSSRRHHLLESVLHKHNSDVTGQENSPAVQLPERYRHVLRKSASYGNVGSSSRKSSGVTDDGDDDGQDLTSRKKDLGTALAWIRHEMVQMKEQDKVLLKRFIELRASILQLRCMYGSASDICSMDGSSVSLNEARKSTRMRTAGSDAMLAESRMPHSTATSSLSLPCSPQLSRLRWRSGELM